MPLMSGYDLALSIKKLYPHIKLYAITGDDKEKVVNKCLMSGFTDVVEKPISYESFSQLL
jgi:CheY-like chemotaxis protein